MATLAANTTPRLSAITIAALFGGVATVLAMEFPYSTIAPPTVEYFLTQLVLFSAQIALLYGAAIVLIASPLWAMLQRRGGAKWWAAVALGAVLGMLLGAVLISLLPFIIPMERCYPADTCQAKSLSDIVLDALRFTVLFGVIPSLTGLLLWRLTHGRTS